MANVSNSKYSKLFAAGFFLLFAVVITYFVISSLGFYGEGYAKTTGVIKNIEVIGWNSEGDADYSVTVAFTVDGVDYEGYTSEYSSSFYKGKSLDVRYEKANPNHFSVTSPTMTIILSVVCLALYIGAVAFVVDFIKDKKRKEKFKEKDAFRDFDGEKGNGTDDFPNDF